MRVEQRTVRIGEYLGPVDWDHDFEASGWDRGGNCNPKLIADAVERLRTLADAKEAGTLGRWRATSDGGVPRVGWGEVLEVGMYDGWPFWEPVPSVMIRSALGGGEWHWWFGIKEIREKEEHHD